MSSEKINVPTGIERDTNPLLHRLTPDQFNASVKFYEADQKLSKKDRGEIATDLKSVVFKTSFIGYGSSAIGFALPTIYRKVNMASGSLASKRLIHRPFLSFIIGLSTMIIVNQQTAKYQFKRKIDELANENKEVQLEAWKAMDYHQAALFYLYYKKTEETPKLIIPDPRTFTERKMHEVFFDDTAYAKRSEHFTKALGMGREDPTNFVHWKHIREKNGFTSKKNDEVDGSLVSSEDEKEIEGTNSQKATSAWESIRNSNSK